MSSSHASSEPLGDRGLHLPSWEWWAMLVLASVAFAFGFYGQWRHDLLHHLEPDGWSIGYQTLQSFGLHGIHLEPPIPWQLHLGRWLAAIVVPAAVVRALTLVFRSEYRLWRLRRRGGHVVICGLGRVGRQLANELHRGHAAIVAIDVDGSSATHARPSGVVVVKGDATDPAVLRRAAVVRARQLIAVCADEQINVAVAAAAGRLAAGGERPASLGPLECWIFVADSRLRRQFQQAPMFPHTGEKFAVNVRGLDMFELAARKVLTRVPLDREKIRDADRTDVHLVIFGFGAMGQHLALQAARIGHYANLRKPTITVVEAPGRLRVTQFLARYPKLSEICAFTSVEMTPDAPDVTERLQDIARASGDRSDLATIAVCWDSSDSAATGEADLFRQLEHDDATNLSVALGLASARLEGDPQVLVFQTRTQGFAALFPVDGRSPVIGASIHAFGMLEDTCDLDTLLHEREDAIARSLHQDYVDNQQRGNPYGNRPAAVPWEQLADRFKDSNRQAADHIAVKLRAIGYRVAPIREDHPALAIIDERHVDTLARMEHARWTADAWLQGFSLGPRDEQHKTHDCLVDWDQLTAQVQDWDRQQVRAIPAALRHAGFGIYPQSV